VLRTLDSQSATHFARGSRGTLEGALIVMSEFAPWVFPAALVGILALMLYRMWHGAQVLKARGRAVRPTLPPDALFGESGASGYSERNLITRFGGASRVLLVWVTKRELVVEAIFPFNVFMYENPYDVEHRVPIDALTSVEAAGRNAVRISFDDASRESHILRLFLKQPDSFVSVLRSLSAPSNTSLERTRER
jgi:hypothetical protein